MPRSRSCGGPANREIPIGGTLHGLGLEGCSESSEECGEEANKSSRCIGSGEVVLEVEDGCIGNWDGSEYEEKNGDYDSAEARRHARTVGTG